MSELLNDEGWIAVQSSHPLLVDPFEVTSVREKNGKKIVSYGLSGHGYDLRLGSEFWVPQYYGGVADPHQSVENVSTEHSHDFYILQPGCTVLGHTYERVSIPDGYVGIVYGKSTYARVGLLVNTTPFEAGWEGTPTISLANVGRMPIKLYVGEGICQMMLFSVKKPVVSYARRSGKYQNSTGVTPAEV